MPKLTEKIKKKIANGLRPLVDEVGEQLYKQLDIVVNCMNIDIKDIFVCSENYDQFWQIVANYYNDYVDMEEYEDASN